MGMSGGHIEVYDSVIYGSKNMGNVNFEKCTNTLGILAPTYGGHASSALKDKKWSKLIAGGGGHGTNLFHDIEFIGFDTLTNSCGKTQRAIGTNHMHSDYHPITHWKRITFRDTTEASIIWMASPS